MNDPAFIDFRNGEWMGEITFQRLQEGALSPNPQENHPPKIAPFNPKATALRYGIWHSLTPAGQVLIKKTA
jgi:hypothetical protein